eukprot:COSAG04_NODE_3034_length_3251_cov_224.076777_6_plen_64_part_00
MPSLRRGEAEERSVSEHKFRAAVSLKPIVESTREQAVEQAFFASPKHGRSLNLRIRFQVKPSG